MKVFDYIAYKNPAGASQFVGKYGLRPHNTPNGLAAQCASVVRGHNGDNKILKELFDFHPDKEQFSSFSQGDKELTSINDHYNYASGNKACACGCSNFSNVDGQNAKQEVEKRLSDKSELLITGGIVLIGLTLVLKLIK
jgi:hypothetical protein